MTNPDALAVLFDANTTFGAFNIGIEISMILLGVLTLQTYNYFTRFPKDPFWIKSMVAFIWCMDISHALCIAVANYIWMIINYGDPLVLLEKTPLSLNLSIFFSSVVSPISQSFFAWRFLVLSRKWFIPIICWFLSLLRLSTSIVILVIALHMETLPQVLEQWKWILIFVFAIGCVTDVLVAACLCYYINRERARAIHGTARVLSKMMEYAIQTGIITSMAEIATIITFLKMPDNLIWLSIFSFLPRLFSNSLLASLNARVHLHEQQRHIHTTFDLSVHNVMSSHPVRAVAIESYHDTTTVDLDTQAYGSKTGSTHIDMALTELKTDNPNAKQSANSGELQG